MIRHLYLVGSASEYQSPDPIVDEVNRTVSCGNPRCGTTYADIHPGELAMHDPGYPVGPMCGGCCETHPLILRVKDPEVEERLRREWAVRCPITPEVLSGGSTSDGVPF